MLTYTTPEAEMRQQAEKKSSSMTALLTALVFYGILVGLFAIIGWHVQLPRKPDLIVQAPLGEAVDEVEMKDFASTSQDRPSSSAAQMAKVVTATATSPVVIPEITKEFDETIDLGTSFGDGFGSGFGGTGTGGGSMPAGSPISERCSPKDRKKRLLEGGGDESTENAVVKGLDWLKGSQNEDGSWGSQFPVAMTGFALLAFLGHCETPDSPKYGTTVTRGLVYLVDKAIAADGRMATSADRHWSYEHGIAAYALAEAHSIIKYGQKKIPRLKEAVTLAIPIIINGQIEDGGWVYAYEGEGPGDTSVTGWQMQALKAASLTGIEFEDLQKATRRGVDFLQSVQGPEGGFGYRSPEDRYSLTGVGVLGQQMAGRGNRRSVRRGLDFLLKAQGVDYQGADANIYGWYYGTQACFQEGGSTWEKWNTMFKDEFVGAQHADGSWPQEGSQGNPWDSSAAGGDAQIYRTTLAILMLEVYYRYLPATK